MAWGGERRGGSVGRWEDGAALHAKAVVADRSVALVTSANFTAHALTRNIELGLLIRDDRVAGGIDAHVRERMQRDVLRRIAA